MPIRATILDLTAEGRDTVAALGDGYGYARAFCRGETTPRSVVLFEGGVITVDVLAKLQSVSGGGISVVEVGTKVRLFAGTTELLLDEGIKRGAKLAAASRSVIEVEQVGHLLITPRVGGGVELSSPSLFPADRAIRVSRDEEGGWQPEYCEGGEYAVNSSLVVLRSAILAKAIAAGAEYDDRRGVLSFADWPEALYEILADERDRASALEAAHAAERRLIESLMDPRNPNLPVPLRNEIVVHGPEAIGACRYYHASHTRPGGQRVNIIGVIGPDGVRKGTLVDPSDLALLNKVAVAFARHPECLHPDWHRHASILPIAPGQAAKIVAIAEAEWQRDRRARLVLDVQADADLRAAVSDAVGGMLRAPTHLAKQAALKPVAAALEKRARRQGTTLLAIRNLVPWAAETVRSQLAQAGFDAEILLETGLGGSHAVFAAPSRWGLGWLTRWLTA